MKFLLFSLLGSLLLLGLFASGFVLIRRARLRNYLPAKSYPAIDGPFFARIFLYVKIDDLNEVLVRVAYVVDPKRRHETWSIAAVTRAWAIAVTDDRHPHHALANHLFEFRQGEEPMIVPLVFSTGPPVAMFNAMLTMENWPEELRELKNGTKDLLLGTMQLDRRFGRVSFVRPPAATVERRQQQRIEWAELNGGRHVRCIVIRANSDLYGPGDDSHLPGTVLYAVGNRLPYERLSEIAMRVSNHEPGDQDDPEIKPVVELLAEDKSCIYHRIRLPEKLVGGVEAYLVDINIYRHLLPGGMLEGGEILICVAEPLSCGGAVEHVGVLSTASSSPTSS